MKIIALLSIALIANGGLVPAEAITKKAPKGAKVKKVDLQKAPGYKEAMAQFKAGHYGPAATTFETLDKTGFCCDTLHYMLAQCYQQTNQLKQAETHYAWIITYSHNPSLRTYSETACQQLQYYSDHRNYGGQGGNFDRGMKARTTGGTTEGHTMKRDSYGNLHL